VAHFFGPVVSVVSGGIGTLVVVAAAAFGSRTLRRFGPLAGAEPEELVADEDVNS
jgi:phosphomevalonate kinase